MSNEVVNIVADNGHKNRWGLGRIYRERKPIRFFGKKWVKYCSWSFFALMTLVSVFYTSDSGNIISDNKIISILNGEHQVLTFSTYLDQIKKNMNSKRTKEYSVIPSKINSVSGNIVSEIPVGAEVMAVLETGATDGAVKAVLTDDLEYSGHVFLPIGTKLIGNGVSTDERLLISFHTAVLEDGSAYPVEAVTYDANSKMLGLTGSLLTRRALKLATATGLNFVAGVSQGLEEVQVNQGTIVPKNNLKNSLLRGAGTAALEQSKEIMGSSKEKQNLIYVKSGTKIIIVFQGANT